MDGRTMGVSPDSRPFFGGEESGDVGGLMEKDEDEDEEEARTVEVTPPT